MRPSQPYSAFKLFALLSFALAGVFVLAIVWETWLEAPIVHGLGGTYLQDFEAAHRWRFIFTSTGFAGIALLAAGIALHRVCRALGRNYRELMAAQAYNESLARHDSLTGLLNRRVFIEQLAERQGHPEEHSTVMLIGMDDFKSINARHGHAAGDSVLCELAQRLRDIAAPFNASVARLGADEYALALNGTHSRGQVADFAQQVLELLSRPLLCIRASTSLTATIGIAMAPRDTRDTSELVPMADSALHLAKRTGRGGYTFFEPSIERQQQVQADFDREVETALYRGEIQAVYQPIVSLQMRQLAGFEVLARWHHPRRGLVSPGEFLPSLQRLGLISVMTHSLLRQVCEDAREWPEHLSISMNISPDMLADPCFPDAFCTLLAKERFALKRFEIEVTERALTENVEAAQRNIERLRARGIRITLDDFGTGHSGLYHLTHLAVDKIKIDRSFFKASADEQQRIVEAILGLGNRLDMEIVAEGIEREHLPEWLSARGCDYAQGYLFGKPMPSAQAEEYIRLCMLGQSVQQHLKLVASN